LQLYKKVLYCPVTNILRTSLHIGTNDLNQKVNGIVTGDSSGSSDNGSNGSNNNNNGSNKNNNDGSNDNIILISPKDANNHARNSGLRILSTIHHYLNGDMSRVEQILNLTGIVNVGSGCGPDLNNINNKPVPVPVQPVPVPYGNIIDGCSQVLAEAFGNDIGIGTRVCFGGSIGSSVACYVELRIKPPPL
jgi:hypothetical protein